MFMTFAVFCSKATSVSTSFFLATIISFPFTPFWIPFHIFVLLILRIPPPAVSPLLRYTHAHRLLFILFLLIFLLFFFPLLILMLSSFFILFLLLFLLLFVFLSSFPFTLPFSSIISHYLQNTSLQSLSFLKIPPWSPSLSFTQASLYLQSLLSHCLHELITSLVILQKNNDQVKLNRHSRACWLESYARLKWRDVSRKLVLPLWLKCPLFWYHRWLRRGWIRSIRHNCRRTQDMAPNFEVNTK